MPGVLPGTILQFGEFELDCGRFELQRKGQVLRVERKPMELLILLASRKGQLVTRTEIAEQLWSSEVFVDTEHGINTAIRKLRQLLRDDPDEPKFIQTVTGMGYRFIAPTVSIEEPAFAKPEQLSAAEPPSPDNAATPDPPPARTPQESPKKLLAIQVAVITLLVALAGTVIFMTLGRRRIAGLLHRDPNPRITSLAVIPLDNLSGDPHQDYFADGMTDELITLLAKDSTLRITSRTSVMQYKGAHRPLPEIARALKVDAILEGSVSRSPDHIHLNLQLIRADTDAHVWAESYDRNDNDAVTLPDQAARAIAEKLNSSSPASAAARTINPQAHDAYLRGEYLWYQGQDEEAIREFNLAISLQPDYAAAWSGLASSYGQGGASFQMDPEEASPKAESAAKKALELDPSLADAHLSMGTALLASDWDLASADREILKAIELDPHLTQAVHLHAMLLAAMNRPAEGLDMQKKASELDPIARPWALPRAYMWTREYDAALNDALPKLGADPEDSGLNFIVSRIYWAKGMEKDAATYLKNDMLISCAKDAAPAIERAYRQGGYRALVALQLSQVEKKSRTRYVSPYEVATLNAELGNHEKAITFLQQSFRKHEVDLIWVQCDPEFDFLHADPRYRSIILQMGLPHAY